MTYMDITEGTEVKTSYSAGPITEQATMSMF